MQTTSRRPARYSESFGHGILDDEPRRCVECGKTIGPDEHFVDYEGDAYCSECDGELLRRDEKSWEQPDSPRPAYERVSGDIREFNANAGGWVLNGLVHAYLVAKANDIDALAAEKRRAAEGLASYAYGLGYLPPLSGGSDAATAEAEVHHGDDYCPECGEFHTPHLTPSDHGYYAAFSGAPRSDAPKRADREGWLEGYDECVAQRGEPVKRGPSPEDVAWAMGYSAAFETGRDVAEPDGLDDVEWAAFNAGVGAALGELQGMRDFDRLSY
jgi:predicted RNA-binding Zn-ribbon protein involved in translation (DUF1610 family)